MAGGIVSQPTHRHDLAHIGLVPVSQLASGTPTSGMVPTYSGVANAAWGFAGGWGANPMTAQDDLIVGGAPSSGIAPPARLGKGSDGQVLTVDPATHHLLWANNAAAERGSSFPAQPAYGNNIPFYRQDLGEWFYYDGTRWLSCTEFRTDLSPILSGGGGNSNYQLFSPLEPGAIWITRASASSYIATNNGSNYVTINLYTGSPTGTTQFLGAFTTAADTQAQWILHAGAISLVATAGNSIFLDGIVKTGSPTGIYVVAAFFYRKIAT